LIEEVEHAKRYACPGGIPIGFLSEEFHPGEAGFALHKAGRASKKITHRRLRGSSAWHRLKF